MLTLEEIKARLEIFSPVQIEFVAQVVQSLSASPNADIRAPGTWLTEQPEWIEYFGLALSVHHSATTVPLGLTSFESVFQNACEHIGWRSKLRSRPRIASLTFPFIPVRMRCGDSLSSQLPPGGSRLPVSTSPN